MAFNINGFSQVGNLPEYITLQDGTISGSPSIYSYISSTDTQATIAAANYFSGVVTNLDLGDLIYTVDSAQFPEWYIVTAINKQAKTVTITQEVVASGDVVGPGASTDNALVRWDGATGTLVQNSVAILTDLGALSGLTGLISSGLTYPTADGTAGQVLGTNGAGALAFINNAAGSWVNSAATPVNMVANTQYLNNVVAAATFNMPATAAVGTMFELAGNGAGGWTIQMNAGQTANLNGSATSVAGTLASTNQYNCIKLVCTVANTTFTVVTSSGVITVA